MDRTAAPRPKYVLAAWAGALAAVGTSLVLWFWFTNHEGVRGERSPAVLLFYLALLGVSVLAAGAGVVSLFGARSWRTALVIVPVALVGIGGGGCNGFVCVLAYLLEGGNLGG